MVFKSSSFLIVVLVFHFCSAGDEPDASKSKRRLYNSPNGPTIRGRYSHAAMYENKFIYTSGIRGVDPKTDKLPNTIDAEIKQALQNIKQILNELGATKENIVHMTNFLKDIKYLPNVNKGYEELFEGHYPARATFQVVDLPPIGNITIHAIAIK